VVLKVEDLESLIEDFKESGVHFRNGMETGPGGKPIELFESPSAKHRVKPDPA
jgi:hypothetical protein